MANKIGGGTEFIQMSTSDMWSVWMDDYEDNFLFCYCLSKDDAEAVAENMERTDTIICGPGKMPEEKKQKK